MFLWVSMLSRVQGYSIYIKPLDSMGFLSGPSIVTCEAFYGGHGARKHVELGKPKGPPEREGDGFHVNFPSWGPRRA